MRVFLGLVCIAWVALMGCRSSLDLSPDDSGSDLQGVYDHKHILRLAQVSGEVGVYRFETCLTEGKAGAVQQGSCVGALYKQDGSDITFSLEKVAKVNLSQEEKERLTRLHVAWKDYKGKQPRTSYASNEAASVVVGGEQDNVVNLGVVGGSTVALFGLGALMRARAEKYGEALGITLVGLTALGFIVLGMTQPNKGVSKKVSDQGLSAAQKKELERIEHIQMMVDRTHLMNINPTFGSRIETIERNKLTTPDDPYSVEVSSVRPVLEYLSRYQHNLGFTTRIEGDKIEYYCLPSGFDENGEIQKNCYHYNEAKTWCEEADDHGVCIKQKSSY